MARNMTGLATKLKAAGYATHMVGKWDAGMATGDHTPAGRGYDTSLIYFHHANGQRTTLRPHRCTINCNPIKPRIPNPAARAHTTHRLLDVDRRHDLPPRGQEERQRLHRGPLGDVGARIRAE